MGVCVRRLPVVLLGIVSMVVGVGLVSAATALGAGDANQGGCPASTEASPGFRASLPDCRAYEMVTPPFKYGEPVGSLVTFISDEGSSIAFNSIGAFGEAGANASGEGPAYVASRGVSGWSALAIEPSATQFDSFHTFSQTPSDLSRDMSRALFLQAPLSSKPVDQRLYVRQPDGSLVDVGPSVPSAKVATWGRSSAENHDEPGIRYAGASPDLSHVLFRSSLENSPESTNWLWPGDTTIHGRNSLYEYVGIGHTGTGSDIPALVGVDNAGNLISQCDVLLGGALPGTANQATIDSYNAISEDGSTVFFTALLADAGCIEQGGSGPRVNELYARINGSSTVAISEPSKQDCSGCDTTEADRAHAVFQGASRDGSRVFFLSEQKLLPGAEGMSLYEFDFSAHAGEKVSLVEPKVLGVARVSEEGTQVYLVSEDVLAGNPDSRGETAHAGADNLYVYNTTLRQFGFIAALSSEDSEDWSLGDTRPVEATPDGRFLLFASVNDLTPDAAGSDAQIYRYDAQEGKLARISIGENGFNDNGNTASSHIVPASYGSEALAGSPGVAITDDGSRIFFSSHAGLTPQALDNACVFEVAGECYESASNIYEYANGHVYLISDGQDRHAVIGGGSSVSLLGASSSGGDVFFTTVDSLAPHDTDTQMDIYDARIDGGFPGPVSAADCEGDACQGGLGAAPALMGAGSASIVGEGSSAAPVSKPVKSRHVKRKPKRRHGARPHRKVKHRVKARHAKNAGYLRGNGRAQ